MAALHVGFVGLGWWGRELADAASRTGGAIAVGGAFSPDPAETATFTARYGGRAAERYDAMLADQEIDAVVLATPHSLHAAQIVAAARAGKHVFVEKPLTLSIADARRALAACRDQGVTLAVGHNRRLLSQLEILRRLLKDGAAGEVGLVEVNYSTAEALGLPRDHWRRDARECPGGAMTALGVHAMDWLHELFGPVAQVQARFASRAAGDGMTDSASALLTFDSGVTATLNCLYAVPYTNRFVVHGSAARIVVEAVAPESETIRPTVAMTHADRSTQHFDVPHVDTLALQLARWAAACRGNGAVAVSGAEAARNVALLEAIVRAADTEVSVAPHYADFWD